MNLNLTYPVKKYHHLPNKQHLYLYECLPNKGWAVVLYKDDDDTMVDAIYFMNWAEALKCYNKKRKESI